MKPPGLLPSGFSAHGLNKFPQAPVWRSFPKPRAFPRMSRCRRPPPQPRLTAVPFSSALQVSLNDSHNQMVVHWAGEKSNVIVALARDSLSLLGPKNSDVSTAVGPSHGASVPGEHSQPPAPGRDAGEAPRFALGDKHSVMMTPHYFGVNSGTADPPAADRAPCPVVMLPSSSMGWLRVPSCFTSALAPCGLGPP